MADNFTCKLNTRIIFINNSIQYLRHLGGIDVWLNVMNAAKPRHRLENVLE
jgi:hypothetical protein